MADVKESGDGEPDQQDAGAPANTEQDANGAASEHGVGNAGIDYDAELRLYNERLRGATGIGPTDRLLDIGCGTGQSTRDAAREAVLGHALGVDISAWMLERARRLSNEEGLRNVSYLLADAQVHRFPVEHFDVGISRFGAMFFGDPVAAFANIGRALRAAARLVLWSGRSRSGMNGRPRSATRSPPRERGPRLLQQVLTRSHSATQPLRRPSLVRRDSTK